jgi:hypothetical protein
MGQLVVVVLLLLLQQLPPFVVSLFFSCPSACWEGHPPALTGLLSPRMYVSLVQSFGCGTTGCSCSLCQRWSVL